MTGQMNGETTGETTAEMTGMRTGATPGETVPRMRLIVEMVIVVTETVIETGKTASGRTCEMATEMFGVMAGSGTTAAIEVGIKVKEMIEATPEAINMGTVATCMEAIEATEIEMQIAGVSHTEAEETIASATASVTVAIGAAARKTRATRLCRGGRSRSAATAIRTTQRPISAAETASEEEIVETRATGEGPTEMGEKRARGARGTPLRPMTARTRWGSGCRAWMQQVLSCATCLPCAASSLGFRSLQVP